MIPLKQGSHQQPSTWRICALFLPGLVDIAPKTTDTTVSSTLRLLEPLVQEIFVITGNFPEDTISSEKIHITNIGIKPEDITRYPMLIRIPKFMMLQLKMSYHLIKIASKIDVVFLAAGAQVLFLPALSAKLLRKRVILLHIGLEASSRKGYQIFYDKTLFGIGKHVFPRLVELLERLNFRLADRIVGFYSQPSSPLLKRYANKIHFGGSRFYVDVDAFKVARNLDSRENLVGYIGRLIEIKGVMNFVKAIPLLSEEPAVGRFVIGGDGLLRGKIENEIKNANWGDKVTLTEGWIPRDKLPQHLNKIKLLVIPSYAEVGPHIVFEAMACGTPVLAPPVGVVPDVIKDGETGFIMENNSPQCIAHNIIRALNHPDLAQIAKNARKLIEREYTHQAAVERYRSILASLR